MDTTAPTSGQPASLMPIASRLARWRVPFVLLAALGIEALLLLNIIDPAYVATVEEDATWMWIGGLMAFPIAAGLILIHRPQNRVGWALAVVAVSAGLIVFMSWYAARFAEGPLSAEVEALERLPAVGQFAGIIALFYLFPDGRPATAWHRQTFRLYLWYVALFSLVWLMSPGQLAITQRPNPLGILPAPFSQVDGIGLVIVLLFALNGLAALIFRWRKADSVTRAQMKYFLAGAIAGVSILVLANIIPEGDDGSLVEVGGGLIVLLGFWSVPTAIVTAILRHRLYDIDRILNRTLVYALLTAALAAVYIGCVLALQAIFRPVWDGSDLSIALTTLIVAALFMPARRRVQMLVDQRFNRRAYDAARTLDAFGSRLRQNLDLETLQSELITVVDETMEPSRVSVWLRPRRDVAS